MAPALSVLQYLLKDLFATNTFWEPETKEATLKPTNDGSLIVTMNVFARKVRVNEAGIETEVPMNDLVEIGIFGNGKKGAGNILYLKNQRIRFGPNRIVVKVFAKPVEAGVDPRNLLIDTETHNNVKQLRSGTKPGT
jgi:hypothetical protein